jgi:preprotein translocase subunit SecE
MLQYFQFVTRKGYLGIQKMTVPVKFLRETYDELKKVVWPTRQEVIRLTAVVIAISVIVGLYIGGLDYGFTKITELIVK